MAETKIRVKTSDGQIVEVDLDVAKQWGPINNMYEGMESFPRNFDDFSIHWKFLVQSTLMKILWNWNISPPSYYKK